MREYPLSRQLMNFAQNKKGKQLKYPKIIQNLFWLIHHTLDLRKLCKKQKSSCKII